MALGRRLEDRNQPKWKVRLEEEIAEGQELAHLSPTDLNKLVCRTTLTSSNHDTGISLDFPHFCSGATDDCGGKNGWCYTFWGRQASVAHSRKAALVDFIATNNTALFAEKVGDEVTTAVRKGVLPYPNLRYAGSGELAQKHIRALTLLKDRGVRLWGFTKIIEIARALRSADISVIVSLDKSSSDAINRFVEEEKFPSAYVSNGVLDHPVCSPFVTFPLHIHGRVREVVDAPNLCPKVLSEFFNGSRRSGTCQDVCTRCHEPEQESQS